MLAAALIAAVFGFQALHAQTADEKAIREADQAWAKTGVAKDLEGILSFLADDASELAPNTPMATGKPALRKVWGDYFATPGFAIDWQPTKVEVARGGDLGYSLGTYQLTVHDKAGKPVTDRGKYVTVWKKQSDGRWKVIVDSFNSDLPAASGH